MVRFRNTFIGSVLCLALASPIAALGAQDLPSRLAVGQPSIANKRLTGDVWSMMQMFAGAMAKASGCQDAPKLGTRVIAESPTGDAKNPGRWVEDWTVSSCQKESVYRVTFTPEGRGTGFSMRPVEPAAPSRDSVPKDSTTG